MSVSTAGERYGLTVLRRRLEGGDLGPDIARREALVEMARLAATLGRRLTDADRYEFCEGVQRGSGLGPAPRDPQMLAEYRSLTHGKIA